MFVCELVVEAAHLASDACRGMDQPSDIHPGHDLADVLMVHLEL
jgi:hypothetical protein